MLLEISCHFTAKAKVSLLVPLICQFKEMKASRSRCTEEQKHPAQKGSSKPGKNNQKKEEGQQQTSKTYLDLQFEICHKIREIIVLRPSLAIKKCIIYQLTIEFN